MGGSGEVVRPTNCGIGRRNTVDSGSLCNRSTGQPPAQPAPPRPFGHGRDRRRSAALPRQRVSRCWSQYSGAACEISTRGNEGCLRAERSEFQTQRITGEARAQRGPGNGLAKAPAFFAGALALAKQAVNPFFTRLDWAIRDSNPRHPACKVGALTAAARRLRQWSSTNGHHNSGRGDQHSRSLR